MSISSQGSWSNLSDDSSYSSRSSTRHWQSSFLNDDASFSPITSIPRVDNYPSSTREGRRRNRKPKERVLLQGQTIPDHFKHLTFHEKLYLCGYVGKQFSPFSVINVLKSRAQAKAIPASTKFHSGVGVEGALSPIKKPDYITYGHEFFRPLSPALEHVNAYRNGASNATVNLAPVPLRVVVRVPTFVPLPSPKEVQVLRGHGCS